MTDRAAKIQEIERLRKEREVERLRAARAARGPTFSAQQTEPETTTGEALLRGAGQGLTLGFADEITGGAETLGRTVFGDEKLADLPDNYAKHRDEVRAKYDKAHADHPAAYTAGQVGGSVATAFVPGLGALNAAKGAGLAATLGKAALSGGIAGLGGSNADTVEGMVGDTVEGGAVGALTAGALKGGGKILGTVKDKLRPSKVASVLLGAPEEAVELYSKNPAAVNSAPARNEITREAMDTIGKLKDQVVNGSAESREILSKEAKSVKGSDIGSIFGEEADNLAQRAEGVWDDQKLATFNWLRHMEGKYRPQQIMSQADQLELAQALQRAEKQGLAINDVASSISKRGFSDAHEISTDDIMSAMKNEGERNLSTNRVKDLVQELQRRTEFETKPGRFLGTDDVIRGRTSGKVNDLLKSQSPAYAEQMKGVAKDSQLLDDASSLAGSPQAMDNLLKRVQQERAFFPAETLKALDDRMKTKLLEKLKLSQAKEAFDRSATNGSRNVKMYETTFGDLFGKVPIPGMRTAGAMTGATVDKYGPAMGKALIDKSNEIQAALQSSEGLKKLGKFAKPLLEAAKRGNKSLAVTHMLLMNNDPEYMNIVGDL